MLPHQPTLGRVRQGVERGLHGLTATRQRIGFWNSDAHRRAERDLAVLFGAINGYALALWRVRGAASSRR
jgi:hypothetical protein